MKALNNPPTFTPKSTAPVLYGFDLMLRQHSRPCIFGESAEHRWHMWLNDDFTVQDGLVHRNVKDAVRLAHRTFHMDQGTGKAVAKQLLANVTPEMISKARGVLAQEIAAKEAEDAAQRRVNRMQKAAAEMHQLLDRVARTGSTPSVLAADITALLKRIDTDPFTKEIK